MDSEKDFLQATAPDGSGQEHWTPENDGAAEWCLKKISEKQMEILEKRRFYESQVKQLEAWFARETAPLNVEIAHFQSLLQEYAAKQLAGKKKRTLSLPSGKFGFRKQPAKIDRNDEALLAYCKENAPDMVKEKLSVDWAGLKSRCEVNGSVVVDTTTGEILPGITVMERPDKFVCEVK